LKDYVQWAVNKKYAVIDVNIPKHVTTEPVSIFGVPAVAYSDRINQSSNRFEGEDENRPTATEELAGYLWDNYIE
jgi:histone deacetylase 6